MRKKLKESSTMWKNLWKIHIPPNSLTTDFNFIKLSITWINFAMRILKFKRHFNSELWYHPLFPNYFCLKSVNCERHISPKKGNTMSYFTKLILPTLLISYEGLLQCQNYTILLFSILDNVKMYFKWIVYNTQMFI